MFSILGPHPSILCPHPSILYQHPSILYPHPSILCPGHIRCRRAINFERGTRLQAFGIVCEHNVHVERSLCSGPSQGSGAELGCAPHAHGLLSPCLFYIGDKPSAKSRVRYWSKHFCQGIQYPYSSVVPRINSFTYFVNSKTFWDLSQAPSTIVNRVVIYPKSIWLGEDPVCQVGCH